MNNCCQNHRRHRHRHRHRLRVFVCIIVLVDYPAYLPAGSSFNSSIVVWEQFEILTVFWEQKIIYRKANQSSSFSIASLFYSFAFLFPLNIWCSHTSRIHFYLSSNDTYDYPSVNIRIKYISKIIAYCTVYRLSIKEVMSVRRMDSTMTDQSRFLLWAFET